MSARVIPSFISWLVVSACVGASSVPAPRNPQSSTPGPAGTPASSTGAEIVTRTNDERLRLGIPALGANAALMRAAQLQAEQMAVTGTLAHDLPGSRYPTLGARLAAVSYTARAAGENIAEGHSTPAAMVTGWMASPAHRANITSRSFAEMGAATARSAKGAVYAVEVFAAPL